MPKQSRSETDTLFLILPIGKNEHIASHLHYQKQQNTNDKPCKSHYSQPSESK